MKYYCNPMNIEYRYQFQRYLSGGETYSVFREAADPSLVQFHEQYYLFPSMSGGFYVSNDMIEWKFHAFINEMPIYDYAPDVRVIGEYLYFCASKDDANCSFYRTKNPLTEPFEEINGTFPFWDPNLFCDDDGSVYFYWGCTNTDPIYGVELDLDTMKPKTAPQPMFDSDTENFGFERNGENHYMPKMSEEEQKRQLEQTIAMVMQIPEEQRRKMGYGDEEETRKKMTLMMSNRPFIEGAWMTKKEGRYYLQYAIPGTEYNVYNDGVYVSEHPLGPFKPAKNNPFSYKPGGFITGAGHGSTLIDLKKRVWHTSTMRIAQTYRYERRLGLWKAGFDEEGELYCDQRYGDWPVNIETAPFADPDFMLLSYQKKVSASSGTGMEFVTDEDIRTHWRASDYSTDKEREHEWIVVDLGNVCDIRAVQINFADDGIQAELPDIEPRKSSYEIRYMENRSMRTQWKLEASVDGNDYSLIKDNWDADTDYAHDFIVTEEGINARYVKLTIHKLPYEQVPAVSGIRVFGFSKGKLPEKVSDICMKWKSALDLELSWGKQDDKNVTGYNICWGYHPDKLYHSYMVLGKTEQTIGALIRGQKTYIRIDSFNETGITKGTVIEAEGNLK